ncbi:hypothetical protein Tco_1123684 [Tanacetum coccineum]|uniref:Uncharacterized protein n=1 Tax=Tanacetum coccineum TaxID=301880 RepID=A0ABQ5J438_9ASTR
MGHRRSLPESHPYRKKKKLFDGKVERRKMARLMNGHDTLSRVKDIKIVFGKKDKASKNNKNIWKKKSIFWKLPYWEHLQVRHSLHKIPGRGSNFCLGRRCLDKDGNLTVPLEIADIANKLDHGGRTRGVSSIVGCKKGLKGYVRKKRTYKQSLDFDEFSEKVQEKLLSGELSEKVQEKLFSGPVWNRVKEKMLEELVKEPIVGTSRCMSRQQATSRLDCHKGEKILYAHASIRSFLHALPDEDILNLGGALNAFIQWPIGAIACFSGSPNTPAISAAAKNTLPKIVQRPSTECSALTNVPAITQASKKRKKTVKAPIQQSEVEKDKADIRKRLHLLKKDIDLRSEAVRSGYYRWMDREDCTMPQFVDFKKEIFRDAHDFTLPINTTDIIELLAGDKLGTNILTLFSSNEISSVIADRLFSFAIANQNGVDEKTFVKATAIDNDVFNPSVPSCHLSDDHTKEPTFNLENFELTWCIREMSQSLSSNVPDNSPEQEAATGHSIPRKLNSPTSQATQLPELELTLTPATGCELSQEINNHSLPTLISQASGPSRKRSRSPSSPFYLDATTFSDDKPASETSELNPKDVTARLEDIEVETNTLRADTEDKELLISELQDSLAAAENEISLLQIRAE